MRAQLAALAFALCFVQTQVRYSSALPALPRPPSGRWGGLLNVSRIFCCGDVPQGCGSDGVFCVCRGSTFLVSHRAPLRMVRPYR